MTGNACSVSFFIHACVFVCVCVMYMCILCLCVSISVGGGNDDGWRVKEGLKQLSAVRVGVTG